MSKPLEVSDPAEGSVDWNGAKEYMERGAGAAEDEAGEDTEAPEAASVREFKYHGKTITVAPEVHSVLEDLRREARGANGRLGSELSRTRERLAKLEGVMAARPTETQTPDEIAPPDPLLATRDITAYQRQLLAYHDASVAKQMAALEAKHFAFVREVESRAKEGRRDNEWADRFYGAYDHLDHPEIKPIVAQVYVENKERIDALDPEKIGTEEAQELLAELADERLVRLKRAGNENPTSNRRPPRVESSAGQTPRATVEDKPRGFSAASWVARQRQQMNGREPKKKD